MKRYAGFVWQRDSSEQIIEALQLQNSEQRRVESTPDTGSVHFQIDVHGNGRRPLVCCTRSVLVSVSITNHHLIAVSANKLGKKFEGVLNALPHLVLTWRFTFEGDSSVESIRGIYCRYPRTVRRVRKPYNPVHKFVVALASRPAKEERLVRMPLLQALLGIDPATRNAQLGVTNGEVTQALWCHLREVTLETCV
jgi:hypothetical protein